MIIRSKRLVAARRIQSFIPFAANGRMLAVPFFLAIAFAIQPLFAQVSPSTRLAIDSDAADVDWLADVQGDAPEIPSIRLEQWQLERTKIARWWMDFLGYDPKQRRRLPARTTIDQELVDGIVRRRIVYESHPGWRVEAYLLHPESIAQIGPRRLPGAVVLHPTVDMSIDEPAGVSTSDGQPNGPRALGWHLAKRGFAVICPRNFLWPTNHRIDAATMARKWTDQLTSDPNRPRKGMGKMLYDVQLAADILIEDGKVDRDQLSVVGHSLGGKEALYAMAFDERFRAGAASEGGIGIHFSNWEAEWYLGEEAKSPQFGHDHDELLSLMAPRPFLIVAGESADGDRGWEWIRPAQSKYLLFDPIIRLGQFNHRQGHPLNEAASQKMIEWIDTYGRSK